MGLYSIRKWAEKKKENGSKWAEPLLLCVWCQPSSWSLLGYLFAYGLGIINKNNFNWNLLVLYPLVVCGSSIICGFIWSYHLKSNSETDMNNNISDAAEIFTESMIEIYDEEETGEEYENRMYHNQKN